MMEQKPKTAFAETLIASAVEQAWSRMPLMVSSKSKWTDWTWEFDSPTSGQTIRIYWDFDLPGGGRSTDPAYSGLLQAFKAVCWGMFNRIGWYGKTLQVGSAVTMSVGVRELFRWLVFRGHSDLGDLVPEVQAQYQNEIAVILTDRHRFYSVAFDDQNEETYSVAAALGLTGWSDSSIIGNGGVASEAALDEEADDEGDARYTYSQVANRINIIYYVYAQSDLLVELGLKGMSTVPYDGRDAGEVVSGIVEYTLNRIPPLPDEVAVPLLAEVIDWVEVKAGDVLRLQNSYFEAQSKHAGVNQKARRNAVLEALVAVQFSTLPGNNLPWRGPLAPETAVHPEHGVVNRDNFQVMRDLILTLRAAILLCLQYFVGMRSNEICSTQAGSIGPDGLPSCVKKMLSKNGLVEMFYLEATLSKGQPRPKLDLWLLGARPVGTDYLPLPVQAIVAAHQLFAPWRLLGGTDDLFVSFSNPVGLPRQASSIGRITSDSVLRSTKKFVFSEVDLSSLPDISERGEDLAIYRDTKGLCIRAHQGRKTFAAYILETRTSFLKAVSQHFKHANSAITSGAYFTVEVRLREDMRVVQEAETIAFFVSALNGMPVYGNMASAFEKMREDGFWNPGDLAIQEARVTDLIRTHDLRIVFSDHGNCLISINPLASRCRAIRGGATWNQITPDYAARTPNMCAGCGCFLFDASHYEYWKAKEVSLEAVLAGAEADGDRHEFFAVETRLRVATSIVRFIERRGNGS
jgi:hypothetical protein